MAISIDEIKSALMTIRDISIIVATRFREVEQLRRDIYCLRATDYSRDVVQGGTGTDIADSVAKLIDVEEWIQKDIKLYLEIRESARQVMHTINNSHAESVMIERYINGLSWKEVMNTLGYSRPQMLRYHKYGNLFLRTHDCGEIIMNLSNMIQNETK